MSRAKDDGQLISRRSLLSGVGAGVLMSMLPAGVAGATAQRLPRRRIPGSDESLPVIGLGNSNAFRIGDRDASWRVLNSLLDYGGSYVDAGGSSRFLVAEIAASNDVADDVFLGAYFSGADGETALDEAERLLEITGKPSLDLMHSYPEDAVPNWEAFQRWKDEGLTRFIGVARHRSEYYDTMMRLMATGTVDFLQVNYSLLETEAEERILPMALDEGVAVTINRPFINGRFFEVVRGHQLPKWAANFDCESWAQFSLKFILSHPAVTCVLTETANPRHALDNIGAGFGRLPNDEERRRMLSLIRSFG
jgi:diketogulonate reductase-like aldo/keto reductase